MARMADQGPILMVRVMEAVVQVPGFKVTITRVVTINRVVRGINGNNSRVIRAIQNN